MASKSEASRADVREDCELVMDSGVEGGLTEPVGSLRSAKNVKLW